MIEYGAGYDWGLFTFHNLAKKQGQKVKANTTRTNDGILLVYIKGAVISCGIRDSLTAVGTIPRCCVDVPFCWINNVL